MLSNRFTNSISIILVLVLLITFSFPCQETLAIEVSIGGKTQNGLIDLINTTNSTKLISDAKADTKTESLSEELSLYYESLKQSYNSNDIAEFRKSISDIVGLLDDYNKTIAEELNENDRILEELGNKEARQRNSEYRTQIMSKLSELNEIFEELELISKNTEDFSELDARKMEEVLEKLDNTFMSEQPENPLGSELPHRNVAGEPNVSSVEDEVAAMNTDGVNEENLGALSEGFQAEELAETQETSPNDQIKELADSLDTVIDMYEYVRNNVDFESYYGSRKGAVGTLAHMSGNDYDQASLLISMLRYKNIPARYVRGNVEIDINRAMAWVKAETPEAAVQILSTKGSPATAIMSNGEIVDIRIEHVWVEAYVPYGRYRGTRNEGQSIWVPLDPSFKQYERVDGIASLQEVIGVDSKTFNEGIKNVDQETGKTTGVNTEAYDEMMELAVQKLTNYMNDSNLGDKTYSEVFGGSRIVAQKLGMLPLSLPHKTVNTVTRFSKVTEQYSDMVTFGVYGQDPYGLGFTGSKDFNVKYKTVDLFNKKVTLSYEPATQSDAATIEKYGDIFSVPVYLVNMVPVLKIDGETVAKGEEIGLGYRQQFEIGIKSSGQSTEIINNDVFAGSFYNVGFNYQKISEYEMDNISSKLKDIKYTQEDIYSDEQLGEILNFVAKAYFAEMGIIDELFAEHMNVSVVRELNECITGYSVNVEYDFLSRPAKLTGGELYIDVDRNPYMVVSKEGDTEVSRNFMIASGMVGSALEHSIWEQVTGVEAVSTMKVLEIAQEQQIPIYTLSKIDFEENKDKLNLSSSVMQEIRNAVNSGKFVTVAAQEVQIGEWSGAGYIIMDPDTGTAAYMISGGIAGGASSLEVDLAFLTNLGFGIWDVVEALSVIKSGIALMALSRVLGVVVIVVGVVLLALALYSLWETIDLYIDYNKGDYEAGQELIENMLWNIGLTLATFGIANSLKPLVKKLTKARIAKTLGEELAENLLKSVEADDLNKLIKRLRKAGASDDVIKEFAERMGKEGLDWLDAKTIFKFTDNELRNLSKLGDDLYNYSDEFLNAFKNSGCQDDIIDAVSKYGDDAVDAVTKYGDDAAEAISKYGQDAVNAIKNYGDDALDVITKYGDDALEQINQYGDDALKAIKNYGQDAVEAIKNHGDDAVKAIKNYGDDAVRAIKNYGDDAVEVITKYGDDAISAINKYGEEGLTAIYYYGDKLTDLMGKHGDDVVGYVIKHGDDAVEAIAKYGDDAIEVITKYGDDALEAISKDIDPDLIKRLDDLGVKPSDYDNFKIVGRESAEVFDFQVNRMKALGTTNSDELFAAGKKAAEIIEESGLTAQKFEDIISTPKSLRPDPTTYLDPSYISKHLSQFDNGGSYVLTRDAYEKFINGASVLGYPDNSLFIAPKDFVDEVIKNANGDLSILEQRFGFPDGYFKDGGGLVKVDINNPNDFSLRMPSGNEAGANNFYTPGGFTSGGTPEAVVNNIPNTDEYRSITFLN
jgi:predicted Fe-Mo cluster-binding NifX family protein